MADGATRIVLVEGGRKLSLDTGMEARQFARAGAARLASEEGSILLPDGSRSSWKIEGTTEIDSRIFAYGPFFAGDTYFRTAADRPEAALDALRHLSRDSAKPGQRRLVPGVLLVSDDGSILELPERTALRSLESAGRGAALDGALRWLHPDRTGEDARAFTVAALAYSLFCGIAPFPAMTAEEAVADIRDGKFLPAALACPGLKPALASALDGILASDVDRASAPRPGLAELAAALGEPGSGGPASFILSLEDDERRRLEQERERRETRTAKTVAKRRFWRRHGKLVLGIAAAAVAVGLGAWNVIDARADRFTTAGLSAREVAETYYGAFDALDPDRLEACLAKGAPKTDVEAVTNLFVIFRVRQAYESQAPYLKAEEWLKAGSPATEKTVFGIADLRIEPAGNDRFLAAYRLFAPGADGERREDLLILTQDGGLWRIADIGRRILSD
jgi:hypothetical protein